MLKQLQRLLNLYLIGNLDIQALEQWLLSNLQAILDSGDAIAIDLANQSNADLVEFSEGLIDELTFREHLESYLRQTETIIVDFDRALNSASNVETFTREVDVLPAGHVAEFRLDHAFA